MEVWHMSGAGNDFMVLDARGKTLDFPKLARELCAQTGADGFMAVDTAHDADFTLHFYNSDGSRGEMCGNGSRCVCRFAYDKGIAGETMRMRTDAGLVPGWRLAQDRYRVLLNRPSVVDLHRLEEAAYVELGDPGVPHAVVELPGLTWDMGPKLLEKARSLRFHPAFPKGANVNFYTRLPDGSARILTFERGVEDYTLACGTGSGSLAWVLSARGELPSGCLTCHNPGGTLLLRICDETVELEGPAEVVKIYTL